MKIRTGFVSNSSSSSFAIFGITAGQDRIRQITSHWIEKEGYISEDLDESIQKCGPRFLSYVYYGEGGKAWIGAGFEDMGQDETKAVFKQKVADALSALTKEPIEVKDLQWFVDSFWS